jgi:Spy/CpxP family protein refolding chaperone
MLMAALALGALLACSSSLRAADTNTPAGTPPAGERGPGMRGGRPDLAKTLDLTEDQKPKVAAIMKEAGEKRKALREDTSLSQEDKRAKAKALQADTTAQMKAVLTADQFAKYEKMGPGMRRNAPPAGGPGTATPPPAQN